MRSGPRNSRLRRGPADQGGSPTVAPNGGVTIERDSRHFSVTVAEVEPAAVPAGAGWVPSMDIRYLSGDISGFSQVCLFRVVFDAGIERGRHRHPQATELLYVVEGHGACGFDDREHAVRPGALEIIPAGTPHWFRNTSHAPLTMVGAYLGVGSLAEAGYEYVGDLTDAMRQVAHD